MPLKKKPLEDARKRLQEKLNNVEEQSEYICQFISDLVCKVKYTFSLYSLANSETKKRNQLSLMIWNQKIV